MRHRAAEQARGVFLRRTLYENRAGKAQRGGAGGTEWAIEALRAREVTSATRPHRRPWNGRRQTGDALGIVGPTAVG